MPSEQFSHRLAAYRESQGLTQAELAGVLGVTPRYLIDLEHGKRDVDVNTSLYKLFDAIERGLVPLARQLGQKANGLAKSTAVNEAPFNYSAATYSRRSETLGGGLSAQDLIDQVRADVVMIESGEPLAQRRAYHLLAEMHLPMLAKLLKLE